jgi:hypothetical protein
MAEEPLQDVVAEFEKSRETSVRLLDALSAKIGGSRAVRQAADYVQQHTPERMVRFARRRPYAAALASVAAGILLAAAVTRLKRR